MAGTFFTAVATFDASDNFIAVLFDGDADYTAPSGDLVTLGLNLAADTIAGDFTLFDVPFQGQVTLFGVLAAVNPQQVPEPGTMLLLGSGILGLAFMGRRFRKS